MNLSVVIDQVRREKGDMAAVAAFLEALTKAPEANDKEAAAIWRYEVGGEDPLKPYYGGDDESEHRGILYDRAAKLIADVAVDREEADVMIGRRSAEHHELVDVVEIFNFSDSYVAASLVSGLVGLGDYEPRHVEVVVAAYEKATVAGRRGEEAAEKIAA